MAVLGKLLNTFRNLRFGLSRLFIELANKNYKVCLTLDCSNVNVDGPGKFRTNADNPESQFCYFNNTRDEQVYNRFISKRIKGTQNLNNHLFEIVEVVSRFNENIKFKADNKLKELEGNGTETSRDSENFRAEKRKRIFDERAREASFYTTNTSESKQSFIRNNEIFRKRAKPGYLLKR